MSKVTVQEIVEALRELADYEKQFNLPKAAAYTEQMAKNIQQHGIAPPDGWVLVTVSDLKYLSYRLNCAGFIFKYEVPDSRNHQGCTYISDAIKMADAMLAATPEVNP